MSRHKFFILHYFEMKKDSIFNYKRLHSKRNKTKWGFFKIFLSQQTQLSHPKTTPAWWAQQKYIKQWSTFTRRWTRPIRSYLLCLNHNLYTFTHCLLCISVFHLLLGIVFKVCDKSKWKKKMLNKENETCIYHRNMHSDIHLMVRNLINKSFIVTFHSNTI